LPADQRGVVRPADSRCDIGATERDVIPPIIDVTISPAANAAGWNNTDVTVSWNWADNSGGAGLDAATCPTSGTSSGEGTLTLTATCKDLAGNQGSASYPVKVDKTGPTIGAAAASQPNADGWYGADVTVRFACADALSGIPSGACPADQVLSSEGAAVSSTARTVADAAGNPSEPSNVVTVRLDKTGPVVAVTGVANDARYSVGAVPAAGCATTDALSGVAAEATLRVTGGTAAGVGTFTASCSGARDKAGNAGSAGVTYTVGYPWSGFFQPVDNPPTVNGVKAGSAVPVKFGLGGDRGLAIFAGGFPASQQVACNSGATIAPIEQTVTAGGSDLSYDAASGQYTYVWKTDKAWAGTCRTLTVKLADGTEKTAQFSFR
jgi:hypothetical protein